MRLSLRRTLFLGLALSLACGPLLAQSGTAMRLLLDKDLSPDGSRIAFAWRGDVWTSSIDGGQARRLTFNAASDRSPRFSPDGSEIAFLSDRDGARAQIWVIPSEGGSPRRITHHSDGYTLEHWMADGSGFLVRANRDHFWRNASRFYIQPLDGVSAPELLFDGYGSNGRLSADGNQLLFTRESTRPFRRRYVGAQESQIWSFSRRDGKFVQLQGQGKGGCRSPLPRGKGYIYAHQASGCWNLYHVINNGQERALTNFSDDGALFPVLSRDGKTLVFNRLFDMYRMDLPSGAISKIDIFDAADPTVATSRKERVTTAQEAAFTDDAREIAFTAGGDLWVMDTEMRETDPRHEKRRPRELSGLFEGSRHPLLHQRQGRPDRHLARSPQRAQEVLVAANQLRSEEAQR